MYCDLPQFKRCCFCLPLRPGLIAWGYIKTIAVLIFTILISIILAEHVLSYTQGYRYSDTIITITMQSLLLIVMLVDIGFSITFLVSAHKKNTELMKKCLYYHVFIFVLSNITFVLIVAFISYTTGMWYFFFVEILIFFLAIGLLNAVLQFYVILLIRSEIQKLNDNCYFKFENNGPAAECHMTIGKLNIGGIGGPQQQDKLELIKEEVLPGKV